MGSAARSLSSELLTSIIAHPRTRASTTEGALALHQLVLAASSSEPPTSVGLACCPVGAWRRHLMKQFHSTRDGRAQALRGPPVRPTWGCLEHRRAVVLLASIHRRALVTSFAFFWS